MSAYQKCGEVKEMLAAFLDDELPCDVSHGIQEHLDRCPPCARLAKAEERFTAALKDCLPRIDAPPGFSEAMRRKLKNPGTLAAEDARQGAAPRPRWLGRGRGGFALAAAAALLVLLAPAMELVRPGLYRGLLDSIGGVRDAGGVLVCLECERKGVPIDVQRHCHDAAHHTGLKCPKTGLWSFVVNEASLPLLSDPSRRGERITLRGRFLNDIRYVDARNVQLVSGI